MDEFLHHRTPYRTAYVHGPPGCGKSTFALTALTRNNFDVVQYNATEERTKTIVDFITDYSVTCNNVMRMFRRLPNKTAIFVDDLDCMHDKLSSLIKIVKPTKGVFIPIVLVGNTCNDKKMKDLIKSCFTLCLPTPSATFLRSLITSPFADVLVSQCNGNLHKLFYLAKLVTTEEHAAAFGHFHTVDTSKTFTLKLFATKTDFSEHHTLNDNDRTIVGMLWHENVIDVMPDPFLYCQILRNMCFADYIDRITFQRQIWQFNKLSSLIKTFYNNMLLHAACTPSLRDVRFTKILTKYSTEYNNIVFIQRVCRTLLLDYTSLAALIRSKMEQPAAVILKDLKTEDLTITDVNRLLRYF
jgi:hypothetical protein